VSFAAFVLASVLFLLSIAATSLSAAKGYGATVFGVSLAELPTLWHVLTAVIWELTKAVLQYCASYFPTYDRLYGSLAGITILVLWLNLTGFSLLLGAEVAAICQEHETRVPRASTSAA